MITNSRAAIKEPREIGKKHPGKTYLPRFLDNTDLSTLKSSIDQELSDIAMHFEQDRQVVSKIVPGSDFKGIWDACTKVYPKAEENSTWDVAVTCGTTVEFDGKTWETGQQLIYLANPDVYVQRTNPVIVGIKTAVEKLEVEVANAKSSITDNKTAIAETNFAFAEADRKLQSEVDGNKAAIQITSTTVADLTQTVANNMETLRAEYKTGDADNAAEIQINKTAIATANSAMASMDTRLQSEIDGNKAGISNAMSTIATVKDGVTNLESKWTVQADVNGKISGIEMVNNGLKSNFTILTDQFVVTDGTTNKQPFTIEGGNVAMNNAIVRGHIEAGSGSFNGHVNATSGSFTGAVYANTGSFKGHIEADSGYFNGSLNVQDQSGNVGMKITNNQILIYDQSGVLRVKIGRL